MPREYEGYREVLEQLNSRFPDHDMLNLDECGVVIGVKKRETVLGKLAKAGTPIVDRRVNKVFLARYMCGK